MKKLFTPGRILVAVFVLVAVAALFLPGINAQTPQRPSAKKISAYYQPIEEVLEKLQQRKSAPQRVQDDLSRVTMLHDYTPSTSNAAAPAGAFSIYAGDADKGAILRFLDFDNDDVADGFTFYQKFDADVATELKFMSDGRLVALTGNGEVFVMDGDLVADKARTLRLMARDSGDGLAILGGTANFDLNNLLIGTYDRYGRIPEYRLYAFPESQRGSQLAIFNDSVLRRAWFRPAAFFSAAMAVDPIGGWVYAADPLTGAINIAVRPGQPWLDSLLPNFEGVVDIAFEPVDPNSRSSEKVLYIVTGRRFGTDDQGQLIDIPGAIYRAKYFKKDGKDTVLITLFAPVLNPENRDEDTSYSPLNGIAPVGGGKVFVIVGGSIRVLRDLDGDGVADQNTAFVPSSLSGSRAFAGLVARPITIGSSPAIQ